MQQRRTIVDINIQPSGQMLCPRRHSVIITYDDESKDEKHLTGKELAYILNKKYEDITLTGPSNGSFILEAVVSGWLLPGYREHREILSINDVLILFNKSAYLKAITRESHPVCFKYKTNVYHFEPMSNDVERYYFIKITCGKDVNGDFIQYNLFNKNKEKETGIIRQEDLSNVVLPKNENVILNNQKKWLPIILDITTKRGQTNADHIPPPSVDCVPYRPSFETENNDTTESISSLKQLGFFAAGVAVPLAIYAISKSFQPR